MKRVFVFNGDADGLCALQQLQRCEALRADVLLTGPKRKTALVQEVAAGAGDHVTVLDLSFDTNRAAVARLLSAGARVRYFDHHHAGALPSHSLFEPHIDTAPDVCTSVIVDRHLAGAQRDWAVVGAFGDNLIETATTLCDSLAHSPAERDALRSLGVLLNYNAYGEREEDLLYPPLALHARLLAHRDPLHFVADDAAFACLRAGYRDDLQRAQASAPAQREQHADVYVLPDAPWARRVVGAFANWRSLEAPERACAVLVGNSRGGLLASVRAPLARPHGAAELCSRFPGGGGRAGAAGVNDLPASRLEEFIAAFVAQFRH